MTRFYGWHVALIATLLGCSRTGLPVISEAADGVAGSGASADLGPDAFVQISAGFLHSCATRQDGGVVCWGTRAGAIGQPRATSLVPKPVDAVRDAVAVSAGADHSCALQGDGHVWCWGADSVGEIGSSQVTHFSAHAVMVDGLRDATAISAGYSHTCAVRADGSVACWGLNDHGQLGDGTHDDRAEPRNVPGLEDISQVAAAAYFSCALTHAGRVFCWGKNQQGALGREAASESTTPIAIDGVGRSRGLSAEGAACAIGVDAAVRCWGALADVERLPQHASQLDVGLGHACAIATNGDVLCWGSDERGQVGSERRPALVPPTRVDLPGRPVQISAGGSHSCALLDDGSGWCWGDNGGGQLGDGSEHSSATAVQVLVEAE